MDVNRPTHQQLGHTLANWGRTGAISSLNPNATHAIMQTPEGPVAATVTKKIVNTPEGLVVATVLNTSQRLPEINESTRAWLANNALGRKAKELTNELYSRYGIKQNSRKQRRSRRRRN
jgi:hypothetical protein